MARKDTDAGSPTGGKKRRAAKKPDVLELLAADHRRVEELVDGFEDAADEGEQLDLAQRICDELAVHAQLEEEIFYPAVREALGEEAEDLLNEAEVEHGAARELVGKIEASDPEDELFAAHVKVLGEYVKHHVQEEENELFALVRDADLDLAALGEAVRTRRQALLEEMGLAGETLPDDDEADTDTAEEDRDVPAIDGFQPGIASGRARGPRPTAR